MRTRESGLWVWLRQHTVPNVLMVRVENAVDVGTPDVFGVCDGWSFVVELKSVSAGRSLVDVELKSEQASTLRRWQNAGGAAWVLVKVDHDRFLVSAQDCLLLLKPITLGQLSVLSRIEPDAGQNRIVRVMAEVKYNGGK